MNFITVIICVFQLWEAANYLKVPHGSKWREWVAKFHSFECIGNLYWIYLTQDTLHLDCCFRPGPISYYQRWIHCLWLFSSRVKSYAFHLLNIFLVWTKWLHSLVSISQQSVSIIGSLISYSKSLCISCWYWKA